MAVMTVFMIDHQYCFFFVWFLFVSLFVFVYWKVIIIIIIIIYRHEIKGVSSCSMNIQHEQVVEALLCHCASQEGLDPTERRDRSSLSTSLSMLVTILLWFRVSAMALMCVIFFHMNGSACKGDHDGIWQHKQLYP